MINSLLIETTPSPCNPLLAHHHLPPSPPLLQITQYKNKSFLQLSNVLSKLFETFNNTITISIEFHSVKLVLSCQSMVAPNK